MTFNARFLDEINGHLNEKQLPKLNGIDLNGVIEESIQKVNRRFDLIEPNIFKNSNKIFNVNLVNNVEELFSIKMQCRNLAPLVGW